MKTIPVTRGGQVSPGADVLQRWDRPRRLVAEDHGTYLVLRPLPADPIGSAMGSLAGGGPNTDKVRAQLRREEVEAESRRWGRS
ncbi:MAG: hypothetical protein ACRDGL_11775 [Candidatus Limnocylindrales bacterium]